MSLCSTWSVVFEKQVLFKQQRFLAMPRLGEHLRNQAIGLLQAGVAKIDVSRRLNCHVSTIARLQNRYNAFGSVRDRPKSGRPRITTRRQDVNMRVIHLRNRFLPASDTARRTIGIRGYVKVALFFK
jgi:hypothetical protein